MQNNMKSQELGSSSSPDDMFIVVFSAIRFTEMGNPKAALVSISKVAAAVVLIRTTGSQERPRPLHNIWYKLYRPVPTSVCVPYPWIWPVGWVGTLFPSQTQDLGPKAGVQESILIKPMAGSRPSHRTISTPMTSN